MKVFVTRFYDSDNPRGTYIRINETHQGAYEAAYEDCKDALPNYTTLDGTHVIDYIEREKEEESSAVRVINPRNGYEYESYIITEVEVGE